MSYEKRIRVLDDRLKRINIKHNAAVDHLASVGGDADLELDGLKIKVLYYQILFGLTLSAVAVIGLAFL